jgi:uncharacterized membrane protein
MRHNHASPLRRRADLTLISFLAIGAVVALLIGVLGRSVWLAMLVGVAPSLLLGALAWIRIRRGRCGGCQFCPMRKPGSCGMPAE